MQKFYERERYAFRNMLADFGGILGLYLGISFCVMFEAVEACLMYCIYGKHMTVRADRPLGRNERRRIRGGDPYRLGLGSLLSLTPPPTLIPTHLQSRCRATKSYTARSSGRRPARPARSRRPAKSRNPPTRRPAPSR